jgi:polyhydroxyalkanoate synthesis regulator phasin
LIAVFPLQVVDFSQPTVYKNNMEDNNLLKQLLMIGIGTTSLVAEKVQEITDQWVKEGRINPEQGTKFVEEMMQQLKLDQTSLEELMQRQIRNMMQDIGVPRQSELDELRGRLDRMERQLRDLENRLWR